MITVIARSQRCAQHTRQKLRKRRPRLSQEEQEGYRKERHPFRGADARERHRKMKYTRGSMYQAKTQSISLELVVLWKTRA